MSGLLPIATVKISTGSASKAAWDRRVVALFQPHRYTRTRDLADDFTKAFEQAAGFLRIRDGANPLDGSAVHPESYRVVEAIARDLGYPLDRVVGDATIARTAPVGQYREQPKGTGYSTVP